MSKIRSLVTSVGLDGRDVIHSSGSTYALVLPARSWVDLEEAFLQLDRAEGVQRRQADALYRSYITLALTPGQPRWSEARDRCARSASMRSLDWTPREEEGARMQVGDT